MRAKLADQWAPCPRFCSAVDASWGILPDGSLEVFSRGLVGFPRTESSVLLPVGYKPHGQCPGSPESEGDCGILPSKMQTVVNLVSVVCRVPALRRARCPDDL